MRGRLTALPLAKSLKAVRIAAMQSGIGSRRRTSSSVMMMVTALSRLQAAPRICKAQRANAHTVVWTQRCRGAMARHSSRTEDKEDCHDQPTVSSLACRRCLRRLALLNGLCGRGATLYPAGIPRGAEQGPID